MLPGSCKQGAPSNRFQHRVSCRVLLAAGFQQAQESRRSWGWSQLLCVSDAHPLSLWLLTSTDWWDLKAFPLGRSELDYLTGWQALAVTFPTLG